MSDAERISYGIVAEEFLVRPGPYEVRQASGTAYDGVLDFGAIEYSTAEFGLAPTISLYFSGTPAGRPRGWVVNLSTGSNLGDAELLAFTAQLEGARQLAARLNARLAEEAS